MLIGHIVLMVNKNDKGEIIQYQQLVLEILGLNRISVTLFENKNKKNENEPDFTLYQNITKKGDKEKFAGKSFKPRTIGGLWRRVSKDGKTNFLAGSIESPLFENGKMHFSCFETKIPENANAEDYFWTYDVVWNPIKKDSSTSYNNYDYAIPATYTQSSNGKNIPVYVEDDAYEYR